MSRTMLVNVVNEAESRVAIVSKGMLDELSFENANRTQIEGNIYKAKLDRVVPSLDAAFVNFGRERNGFLALSEIHPSYFSGDTKSADAIKKGTDLLVQVKKGEIGQKGAALTTYISLPGRYMVLMPQTTKRGVSRKIDDESTRNQLKKIVDGAGLDESIGYIVRTAAEGRTKQDVVRDVSYLNRMWKRIERDYKKTKAPGLIYREADIVIRTCRDYFTPDIKEVIIDDPEVFQRVSSFFSSVMPWNKKRLKLYKDKTPLFTRYQLEGQIGSISSPKVDLPTGGSIVIERTEALVSVDVNSGGGGSSKDIEETAFNTNKEAAEEVARQLKLRDLGGLIVIDFIDMRSTGRRAEIKKTLQKALKEDKARTDVGSISKFGMLELSRQRLKTATGSAPQAVCPTCSGTGVLQSTESFALKVLRLIQSRLAEDKSIEGVKVGLSVEAGLFLLNRKRDVVAEMETTFKSPVSIFTEPAMLPNSFYVEFSRANGQKVKTESNLPADFVLELLNVKRGLPGPEPVVTANREEATAYVDPGDVEAEETAAEEASPKRNRRRRRRRGGSRGRRTGEETARSDDQGEGYRQHESKKEDLAYPKGEDSQPPERNAEEVPAEKEGDSTEGEKPKTRRSRRRRRSSKKPFVDGIEQPLETKPEQAEPQVEDLQASETGDKKEESPKPSKKRTRRSPRNTAKTEEGGDEGAPSKKNIPKEGVEGDAAKPPKKRAPRKRSSASDKDKKGADETAEAAETKPAPKRSSSRRGTRSQKSGNKPTHEPKNSEEKTE